MTNGVGFLPCFRSSSADRLHRKLPIWLELGYKIILLYVLFWHVCTSGYPQALDITFSTIHNCARRRLNYTTGSWELECMWINKWYTFLLLISEGFSQLFDIHLVVFSAVILEYSFSIWCYFDPRYQHYSLILGILGIVYMRTCSDGELLRSRRRVFEISIEFFVGYEVIR